MLIRIVLSLAVLLSAGNFASGQSVGDTITWVYRDITTTPTIVSEPTQTELDDFIPDHSWLDTDGTTVIAQACTWIELEWFVVFGGPTVPTVRFNKKVNPTMPLPPFTSPIDFDLHVESECYDDDGLIEPTTTIDFEHGDPTWETEVECVGDDLITEPAQDWEVGKILDWDLDVWDCLPGQGIPCNPTNTTGRCGNLYEVNFTRLGTYAWITIEILADPNP